MAGEGAVSRDYRWDLGCILPKLAIPQRSSQRPCGQELDELDKEFSKYVFLSFNDALKVETERAQQSAWERDESKRWQQQEANVKRQAKKWSKMAIDKCKEIRERKSFSGPVSKNRRGDGCRYRR